MFFLSVVKEIIISVYIQLYQSCNPPPLLTLYLLTTPPPPFQLREQDGGCRVRQHGKSKNLTNNRPSKILCRTVFGNRNISNERKKNARQGKKNSEATIVPGQHFLQCARYKIAKRSSKEEHKSSSQPCRENNVLEKIKKMKIIKEKR